MTFQDLRKIHPRLIYKSFQTQQLPHALKIRFVFLLEPNIYFSPIISIPIEENHQLSNLEDLIFHLGLIELISYWKAACPQEIIIEAGYLTEEQIRWWKELYLRGLGEFFYQNQIDFTDPNFLTIKTCGPKHKPIGKRRLEGDLLLTGAGRDSVVSLELLKNKNPKLLVLNPSKESLNIIETSKLNSPIAVQRIIDLKLIDLNRKGYLNGHTPFSAYLSFLGLIVGLIYGLKNVIVSNERSSNFGNVTYNNQVVNHQYSKSFDYEQKFRQYVNTYLSKDINYFSILRPLWDLQISQIFLRYPEYFSVFKSCNNPTKNWCGKCAKCVFVYLSLSPFVDKEKLIEIFGHDLFQDSEIKQVLLSLTGINNTKPFECVGTQEETQLAVWLTIEKYKKHHEPLPEILAELQKNPLFNAKKQSMLMLKDWNNEHFLPKELEDKVKQLLNYAFI